MFSFIGTTDGHALSELMSVPDDLRNVLEQCLAEDANPENLELYLPTVRQIITNLLQGLRGKQSIYRRIVSDHKHRSESGSERAENRTSRSRREGSHRSQLSRTTFGDSDSPSTPPSNLRERDSASSRKSTQQSSGRRKDSDSPSPSGVNGDSFVGGFAPAITEQQMEEDPNSQNDYFHVAGSQSRKPPRTVPPPIDPPPPDSFQRQYPNSSSSEQTAIPAPALSVPASVKRYSLVDKPAAAPAVVVEPSSPYDDRLNGSMSPPPPDTPSIDVLEAPAMANSLAALKKSDALERRASKRFSTYNISKMTGAPTTRERSTRNGLGAASRPRSLAASNALTPGDLASLTEVDDEEPDAPLLRRGSSRTRASPGIAERRAPSTPPVPPLPVTPTRTPEPVIPSAPSIPDESDVTVAPIESPPDPTRFTVFLQLGREVKKVTVDRGLSFPSLRVLFVDKFSYNPGQENFPAIYIRDPSSGVQYELEEMEEVKERCLLSLNIERASFCFSAVFSYSLLLCSTGPNQTAHRRPNF